MKKVLFFLSFLLITSLFAQNVNFNLTGAGARAAGMGGAFIGVADDATAIVWNPAGLTLLERPEASIVTRFVGDSYTFEFMGEEEDETQSHFVLNFISCAYPFRFGSRKIVGALAVQRQIDLYNYYKGNDYESEGVGGVDTATLGAGIQILPFLYAGFAQNFWFGKYEYKENFRADYESEEKYSGMNFVFGAMLDLNGLMNPVPFKVGFTFRSPFTLNIEFDDEFDGYEEELDMPLMLGFGASYRLGEFFTLAADYETRKYSEVDFPFDMNQFRVGAEYLLVTDFAVIPLRFGFNNHPTFMEDENEDQIMGTGVGMGSGLIFERFALDLSLSGNVTEIEIFEDFTYTITQAIITISGIVYFE
ncbi:hypothetical protein ACFLYK_02615 [Candidatus Cloacimonadota bacterium]